MAVAQVEPSLRRTGPAMAVFVVLAALAWVVTIDQARGMGVGPGTMDMAFPFFIAMWVVMMAAMMFPSVGPIAAGWARMIAAHSQGWDRTVRMAAFVGGYLVAWTGYGMVAFAALIGTQHLVDASPGLAHALGVVLFAAAGLYQLTPLKDRCLTHCRSPFMQLLHYAAWRGVARDLRVGLHHGAYCVGCCWGLMVVLIAVGVMNVAAMAAIAAVIFLEKLWRHGPALSRLVGAVLIVLALVAVVEPDVLPALQRDDAGMEMEEM